MRGILVFVIAFTSGCASAPRHSLTPLQFTRCEPDSAVECAEAAVPLRWSECPAPEACSSPLITVSVRVLRAPTPARGQLWALDGGPGFSGDDLFHPAFADVILASGYDLVVPTHRGALGSSALSCPVQSSPDSEEGARVTLAEMPACRRAIEEALGPQGLAQMSSLAAGHDVALLMTRMPSSGQVAVFGGSYGTLWAQRVLQVAPDAVDLVWLDSIVDLEASLERTDAHADAAARAALEGCAMEPRCRDAGGGDPVAQAEAVLAAYEADEGCAQHAVSPPIGAAELRALTFRWLSGRIQDRTLIAELFARATRCSPEDENALVFAVTRAREPVTPPEGPSPRYSPLLNTHIVVAELRGERAPTPQAGLLASRGADQGFAALAEAWGAPRLRLPTEVPSTRARMVLLSGALDPLDPPAWARSTAARWGAELVELPAAGHSVGRYTGTPEGNCAQHMLRALLEDPSAPLATGCLDSVETIDWAHARPETRAWLQSWFGG